MKLHNNSLPDLKKECISSGIQSRANEVIKEMAKEFQKGYDFALDKLNLPIDHELRVTVERPEESDEEEEEKNERELVEEPKYDQVAEDLAILPVKGQVNAGGLVDNNAPAAENDPQISFVAIAD